MVVVLETGLTAANIHQVDSVAFANFPAEFVVMSMVE